MKHVCMLISVADINAARKFYEDLFGLEVFQDYGRNIAFTCGLALQQDFDWLVDLPKEKILKKSNNAEIVFEEQDFDSFLNKLKEYPNIEYLGEVIEHSWGQRVFVCSFWHRLSFRFRYGSTAISFKSGFLFCSSRTISAKY